MAQAVATLQVGDEQSSLVLSGTSDADGLLNIPVGVQQLLRQVLKHSPPTPGELEAAIAVIEDAVMPLHALVPANAELQSTDACIWDLALAVNPAAQGGMDLSIDAVEQLFDLLAALALGRPASIAGIPSDAGFAAALLMVRELMHHLHFNSLRVAGPQRQPYVGK